MTNAELIAKIKAEIERQKTINKSRRVPFADKGVEKGFKFKDTIKCPVCGEDVTIDHIYSDLINTQIK